MLILVQELGSNVLWQENGVVTKKNKNKFYHEKGNIIPSKSQEEFNCRRLSYNLFGHYQYTIP